MMDIYHNMAMAGVHFGKRVWKTDQPGRAVCPQAAVHSVWNILYSVGEHDRKPEANGALETERPTSECRI